MPDTAVFSRFAFPPSKIFIHHSLTVDSGTVSWGAIRRYHVETNGWKDIGYHCGVELAGAEYEAMLGRPWDDIGAHCVGQNAVSLGICFVGNFDITPPPDAQLIVGAKLLKYWCRLFGIDPMSIYPHSLFADKTCPGTMFDMEKLREMVKG
jgi:N-acetylmuramoyl-L-alanine amidase